MLQLELVLVELAEVYLLEEMEGEVESDLVEQIVELLADLIQSVPIVRPDLESELLLAQLDLLEKEFLLEESDHSELTEKESAMFQ